jgi:hypothetical protein
MTRRSPVKALGLLLASFSICPAQTQYDFVSLTGYELHRFATASKLSQSGTAIGRVDSDGAAAVFTRERGTMRLGFASTVNGINAAGDIVGFPHAPSGSFLSEAPYDTYFDLVDLNAFAINDERDILGGPLPGDWFPGLNINLLYGFNNAGQVVGSVFAPPSRQAFFLYTPGKGTVSLPSLPVAVNNNGDMLFGEAGAQYIQTSAGQIPLPSGYRWVGINDRDEAVGYSGDLGHLEELTPVYYSNATGLVDLSTRFENTRALVATVPVDINNNGEILVNFEWRPFPGLPAAPSAGVALLVPRAEMSSGSALSVRARATRVRHFTMNGVQVSVSGRGR